MKKFEKPFTSREPIHDAPKETEDELDPIQELSQQRPLHHGERADTMVNDAYNKVPQADEEDDEEDSKDMQGDLQKEQKRSEQNVDEIAKTIMQMIDAVDSDECSKIKTICIEIGLE